MTLKKKVDFLWKIVLCGDAYVGKTSIRKKSMGENFTEEYISTVGADFSSYKFQINDLRIGYQVWDLAGQDKYRYIRSSFYGGATGCFLVYDVTSQQTLTNLISWIDEAIRYSNGTIEIFIVCGNKIDLEEERVISREMGEKFTKALRESSGLHCEYIETSALTGENIGEAFDLMAQCLLEREGIAPRKRPEKQIIEEEEEEEEEREEVQEPELFSRAEAKEEAPIAQSLTKDDQRESPTEVSKRLDEKLLDEGLTDKKIVASKSPLSGEKLQESIKKEDQTTDELVAEVMEILGDSDEIIIGKEIDEEGEKTITVTRNELTKHSPLKEETPEINSSLEAILYKINDKLESLTKRLDGLEKEITEIQYKKTIPRATKEKAKQELDKLEAELQRIRKEELMSPSSEMQEEKSIEVETELDEPLVEEEVETELDEPLVEEEQPFTEAPKLEQPPSSLPKKAESIEEKMEKTIEAKEDLTDFVEKEIPPEEDFDEFQILENLVKMEEADKIQEELEKKKESEDVDEGLVDIDEELVDIDEELVDIPQEESLRPIPDEGAFEAPPEKTDEEGADSVSSQRKEKNIEDEDEEEVIGTELSSAMISELKTISQQSEEDSVPGEDKTPFRVLSGDKEKRFCPVCGQELKYIRQYNKYYCTQCGRYII